MNAPIDGVVEIERGGEQFSATYRVIGGVLSVNPSLGEPVDVNIDNYDRRADEIAREVLERRIASYLRVSEDE